MTTLPTANANAAGSSPVRSSKFALKTEDFIRMMVTQLQNQDPLEPAKNEQLLAQMSQIGQLQASQDLQGSLKTLILQNNLGAAGNLIGKLVQGKDAQGEDLQGVVTSVRVEDNNVMLELDSGKTVDLSRVTAIAQNNEVTT
jgi:flagellar basal-body rod modification protein FlgD